jgi:hypothetical protein
MYHEDVCHELFVKDCFSQLSRNAKPSTRILLFATDSITAEIGCKLLAEVLGMAMPVLRLR